MFAEGVIFLKRIIFTRFLEWLKVYYRKVKSLSDSPQRIAGGAAIGLFFDFLPVPIISIPVVYLVARLARCNAVAAVATVLFFKLAVPFFFTLNMVVGSSIFGDIGGPDINSQTCLFDPLLQVVGDYGYSFLAGSLVNASLAGLSSYFLIFNLLEKRRKRKGA